MNEAEFSRSIGKLINNRLTKDKAKGEDVAKLFDHPNRNQSEIDRAVRLAVFGICRSSRSTVPHPHCKPVVCLLGSVCRSGI